MLKMELTCEEEGRLQRRIRQEAEKRTSVAVVRKN